MARMICLPGLLCTPELYDHVLDRLTAEAQVIALPDRDSFSQIASDIAANLPDRVVLVGMSMGSYLCLEIARQLPGRIAGLVLIGCTADGDSIKAAAMRDKVIAWARREGMEALAASICDGMLGAAAKDDMTIRQSVTRMAHAQGMEVFARHQKALAGRPDNSAALAEINCPALVMTGAEDRVTPPQVGRALADSLPNGRFVEIEGAGHLAVLEKPDLVAAQLDDFMTHVLTSESVVQ